MVNTIYFIARKMYHYDDMIGVQLRIDCAYNKLSGIEFSSQYGGVINAIRIYIIKNSTSQSWHPHHRIQDKIGQEWWDWGEENYNLPSLSYRILSTSKKLNILIVTLCCLVSILLLSHLFECNLLMSLFTVYHDALIDYSRC